MRKIKNLALCGGGVYGYAEVGVLSELEQYHDLLDIKKIAGVSVGSIVATLYAIGYTPTELREIMFKLDFDNLIKDNRYIQFPMTNKLGLYNAYKLEEEIERLIREKTKIKNCTFSQIPIDLTIIATNLNYQQARLFSKEYTPDAIVSKVVRMSIAYPIIFTPVMYEGDLYGDGGETMNYPICLFNNLDETIGITFAAYNENSDGSLKERTQITSMYDYIISVALTMSRSIYTSQIKDEHLKRSIIVKITEKIDAMSFNLTLSQKQKIFDCGVNSTKEQILKFNKN